MPDERFQRDFAVKEIVTNGQGKRLAKYVLCRLESDLTGIQRDYEADTGSIEHILPENPSAEWAAYFAEERQKDFIYRIGNLTLLESTLNRRIGNALLADKLPSYAQSRYGQTQGIVDDGIQEWMPAALDQRQQRMAQRAVHIWRADFA